VLCCTPERQEGMGNFDHVRHQMEILTVEEGVENFAYAA
jgi:hypothetical protein